MVLFMMDYLAGQNPQFWQITFNIQRKIILKKAFGSEVIIPPPCLSNLVNNGILLSLSFFISKIKIVNSQYYRGYYIMWNIISEHKLNVVNISLDNGGKFHLFNCENIVRK